MVAWSKFTCCESTCDCFECVVLKFYSKPLLVFKITVPSHIASLQTRDEDGKLIIAANRVLRKWIFTMIENMKGCMDDKTRYVIIAISHPREMNSKTLSFIRWRFHNYLENKNKKNGNTFVSQTEKVYNIMLPDANIGIDILTENGVSVIIGVRRESESMRYSVLEKVYDNAFFWECARGFYATSVDDLLRDMNTNADDESVRIDYRADL